MTSRLRLMGPVIFRITLLLCASLASAGLFGHYWGFAVMIAGLLAEVFMHINYVAALEQWLENPNSDSPPSAASDLWNDIYTHVHRSRRQLEKNTKRLQDREARYRKTLGALPEGIILVKNDWAVSWCNENACGIFGIRGEDDFGRHLLALIKDDAIAEYVRKENFDRPITWSPENSTRKYEIRIVVADRKNALIIARDVTEQERLDATRRDFVANVSHELRTPLTVLTGFLDMALHGVTGKVELQKQHLELMRDQAERMRRLINDLLTLSRLEIGNSDKVPETISADALVEAITQEIQVMAANTHKVTCSVQKADLDCYPDEVRSAIVNLMTNAVRYTPAGGEVHAECRVNAAGCIEISVRDNGIGIDKKDIPRLTERFYRVDKSRSRDTGGTGLGLAIVKHVLLHHNAHMKIESEPGKGSTFTFTFPSSLCPAKQ